jgi:Bacteriophage probable baseplate hub protein
MTELFAATAPVFKVGGTVSSELARDVSYLRIEEATDGLKTLELRLLAEGPRPNEKEEGQLYLDGQTIDFGKAIEVSIGPADAARIVFTGAVSAIEANFTNGVVPSVTAFAEDALMKLRLTRRMKTYENVSDADIAQAIAAEHGIQASASADGPTYKVVQQWNQSDLAFLRERARLIQAELWFSDNVLYFSTRGNRTSTALSLVLGDDLLEAQLRADLAHQRTTVKVSGYDASQRDGITEEAGSDAIQAEISGGRTGGAVLQQAFGERVSFRVRGDPLASDEARAWARAEMLRRARSFVTMSGMTNGTADMIVGSKLSLDRVGAPFTGDGYYVTRVCHTYDLVDGFRTHFDAERATVNEGGA